jgi:hypothetical protein
VDKCILYQKELNAQVESLQKLLILSEESPSSYGRQIRHSKLLTGSRPPSSETRGPDSLTEVVHRCRRWTERCWIELEAQFRDIVGKQERNMEKLETLLNEPDAKKHINGGPAGKLNNCVEPGNVGTSIYNNTYNFNTTNHFHCNHCMKDSPPVAGTRASPHIRRSTFPVVEGGLSPKLRLTSNKRGGCFPSTCVMESVEGPSVEEWLSHPCMPSRPLSGGSVTSTSVRRSPRCLSPLKRGVTSRDILPPSLSASLEMPQPQTQNRRNNVLKNIRRDVSLY